LPHPHPAHFQASAAMLLPGEVTALPGKCTVWHALTG